MSKRFENYDEAYAYAWARAKAHGTAMGIRRQSEYGRDGFNVNAIPLKKEHRFGSDFTCEAVEPPSTDERTQG